MNPARMDSARRMIEKEEKRAQLIHTFEARMARTLDMEWRGMTFTFKAIEWCLTLKMWDDGQPVVAHIYGETLLKAMERAMGRVDNDMLKFKPDKWALEKLQDKKNLLQ